MGPGELEHALRERLERLYPGAQLPARAVTVTRVDRRAPAHVGGHWATPAPMRCGIDLGAAPDRVATSLAAALRDEPAIAGATAVAPGFVNLVLTPQALLQGADPFARPRPMLPGDLMADLPARLVTDHGMLPWEEVAAVLGEEVARFVLARRGPRDRTPLTLERLARCTAGNPAHPVLHAHARLAQMLRAADAWPSLATLATRGPEVPTSPLTVAAVEPPAERLFTALADHDRTLARAQRYDDATVVTGFLEDVAVDVHDWLDACPPLPVGQEPVSERHRARVGLAAACATLLREGLASLGIAAPEHR